MRRQIARETDPVHDKVPLREVDPMLVADLGTIYAEEHRADRITLQQARGSSHLRGCICDHRDQLDQGHSRDQRAEGIGVSSCVNDSFL